MSSETTADDHHPQPTAEPTPQSPLSEPPSTDSLSDKLDKMKISTSFNIWPPTQRTRDAITNRLIETLSTPSILSKRYGTMSIEEATATAKSIEEAAFSAASGAAPKDADKDENSIDDGIEILQVYSKEISKRVLEAVKTKSSTDEAKNVVQSGDGDGDGDGDVVSTSEEVSVGDNGSSSA